MLETLIVYGLLLLFFVLLAGFVGVVLLNHPYSDPAQQPDTATVTDVNKSKSAGNGASYGILAALILFFCVLTIFVQRDNAHH
jgi:hypothetical protein